MAARRSDGGAKGDAARAVRSAEARKRSAARQAAKTRKQREAEKAKLNRKCFDFNAYGDPCGSHPLKPGTVFEGPDGTEHVASGNYCRTHAIISGEWPPEASLKHAFMRAKETGYNSHGERVVLGRPRPKKPTQVLTEAIESNPIVFLDPYLRAAGIEVTEEEDAETGESILVARKRTGGGAKLYATSKDGDLYVSEHDDLEAMQRAVERLFDRVLGKPRQALDLGGQAGKPIEIKSIPKTPERASKVAAILAQTGALGTAKPAPHEGRQRRRPVESEPDIEERLA